MIPTPITDNADLYDYQTAVDTCRKLEQDLTVFKMEREAAIRQAVDLTKALWVVEKELEKAVALLRKAKNWRDMLPDEYDQWLYDCSEYNSGCTCPAGEWHTRCPVHVNTPPPEEPRKDHAPK